MPNHLRLDESKWHGSRYYLVRPEFNYSYDWYGMYRWCHDTFGMPGDKWGSECERYYINNGVIWFHNEADRILFLLRWA